MSPSVVQLPRVAPLAAMIGALLAAHGALAATAAEAPAADPVQMQTVVVYGVAPSSALTFETDPRLPRQPVPASDGSDYLRTIPGFNAVRNGGTNSDPVLRGMFGSRLNLLAGEGATHGACPSRMDNAMSYVAPETGRCPTASARPPAAARTWPGHGWRMHACAALAASRR